MTLLVPQVGEEKALRNFLNNTAPENQTLKLFANNITPAETDTHTSYTEAAGGGYASKSLTGANWTFAGPSPTTATYNAEQVFTFTGPLTTNPNIYGYYVVQATSGVLLWAETSTVFTPTNNGDQYKITPKITAD
jgi:hypothetical protein